MQGAIIKRGSVTYKVATFLFYASYLCISSLLYCSARDTVTVGNPISDDQEETLVSAGKRFELGFFTPGPERSDNRRYIGIWYHGSNPKTIVWVANRDKPLPARNGVLAIEDGNLNLRARGATGNSYWSTTSLHESNSTNKMVKLMDSGNLVLSDGAKILWQSFDNPTDTFLPGMYMDKGHLTLTSWKDELDPGRGNFTFKKDQDKFVIRKNEIIQYWVGGVTGEFFTSDEMLLVIPYLLSNFTEKSSSSTQRISKSINFPPIYKFTNMTVVMNSTGKVQYWSWDGERGRRMVWEKPSDRCSVFNVCGDYGSCNLNRNPICKCLPGYKPTSTPHWNSGEFFEGCSAESTSCDQSYKFLALKRMKVGKPDSSFNADNETECNKSCNNNCNYCKAYSYNIAARDNNREEGIENCRIWTAGLLNLQEDYTTGGHDLSIRVATSDIESTTRNCDNCGTNLIPYPLSTGPTCGDPLYSSFHCDTSTDQLSFKVPGGVYRVSSIDRGTRTFVIAINVRKNMEDNCDARNSKGIIRELNQSLPFHVTNWCLSISSNIRSIEIGWNPSPEPTCISSKDCQDWPHSRCNATANGEGRCQCKRSFRWDPITLNCTESTQVEGSGRLEPKSDDSSSEIKQLLLIVGVTVSSVSIFSCAIVYIYIWRRNVRRRENIAIRRNPVVHRFDSERHAKHLIDSGEFKEEDKKGIDVPFFEFESIVAATDNFSDGNKLGQGGYGPVYKGTFPGGKEIAVKRLSSFSGQGLQEFKNEIVLIAKLQHRNLVKLWGYCVKGEEKILLYEYMPNRSLDAFIFDSKLSGSLDWEMRLNIISGIARGLLYLHQDSRLRIIHRDMKTSNILLDEEMNPKISDFGLARIVGGKQNEANTNRVVGTYGYMSPEYALDGIFSVKSDVFSFGVVLLEIISGKRNTGFSNSEEALNLLGYTWRLWKEDHVLDLMDEALHETCNRSEFVKCVNVGLLCVQEDPNDRPTMSNVVFMLGSENATLPSPKPAAFVLRRGIFSMASSSSKTESNADNFMISFDESR